MDFESPPPDPIAQVEAWLEAARRTDLPNPNAMTLATADADGRPAARIVLLRGLDARGAVFYTNRLSRKGRELADRPRAALLFHWDPLDRQVRIEGTVDACADEESDTYWSNRPRRSQIAAWASAQSEPIASRAVLERRVDEMEARFEGDDVPRPPHWGGYRVALESIELWQGVRHRLHDRVVYTPDGAEGWRVQRLAP